jgi:hypothetical protein
MFSPGLELGPLGRYTVMLVPVKFVLRGSRIEPGSPPNAKPLGGRGRLLAREAQ